jgi:hypothetical protein
MTLETIEGNRDQSRDNMKQHESEYMNNWKDGHENSERKVMGMEHERSRKRPRVSVSDFSGLLASRSEFRSLWAAAVRTISGNFHRLVNWLVVILQAFMIRN